jgi:quinol monooxygenase YgiN
MFTRRVVFRIRADSSAEFTRIVEGQFLPPLRAQDGCRHEDTFITPEFSEAVINSYWDTEECAAAYARTAYPEALEALAGVLDGEPRVESFHVSSLTFRQITANRRGWHRTS